jgi:PIN domain nuclease of toxin-antitoxin system
MRALLDTHAWVWWATEDRRLSRRARSAIVKSQNAGELWLSLISVWELAKKVEKKQLVLDRPLDEWLDLATGMAGMHLADLARPVLVESCRLPQPFHGDPADQIIVATARQGSAVLITRDTKIRTYAYVRSLW